MEELSFWSLEDAWIEISNRLSSQMSKRDLKKFIKASRNIFFCGAIAACSLIHNDRVPELTRDVRKHLQELKEASS